MQADVEQLRRRRVQESLSQVPPGKAYSGRNTTDCPYFDETVEGARRALGNQDFQDVATQGKAVRWPENYQQAQRFGKVVGKLDSEYIEGSKTISPDDLAFLRRKKRMQERGEDETTPDPEFLKGGYGLSKNNYLRIVKCAHNNSMLRNDYKNIGPLQIRVSEDRKRIGLDDEASDDEERAMRRQAMRQQCKFRDQVLLYRENHTIEATINKDGVVEAKIPDANYILRNVFVFLPDPSEGWIKHDAKVTLNFENGIATGQMERGSFEIKDGGGNLLLILNGAYEFAYVLSDVDDDGSFETILENPDADYNRMVFSDTQWVNAEPVPVKTNVWKSQLRHWISTGNATGTFGLPALCAMADIQRKGATRPSNTVKNEGKEKVCQRAPLGSVERKIRECDAVVTDDDKKNDLYRKDDFKDGRFRLSMFAAMDVATCPAIGPRGPSVVESVLLERKENWTERKTKKVMKKVVDALVKVLEGAKIICENRGKKQVLGQDIIDHLLRTYPGSYRKVFHQKEAGEDIDVIDESDGDSSRESEHGNGIHNNYAGEYSDVGGDFESGFESDTDGIYAQNTYPQNADYYDVYNMLFPPNNQ